MHRNHRHMAGAKDGNTPLSSVLEECQLLGKGVNPVERRQIKGPGHRQRQRSAKF